MGGSGSKVTPFNSTEDSSTKHAQENFTEVTASLSNKIKELEQQLELKNEASRSTDDKLQASQHQVELLCTEILGLQESLASRESSSRSVNALEHMVGQLKGELEITQAELQDMDSYEKRLQRVRSSSAKLQAESALSLYELRDDNQRLETENEKLSEQISQRRESSKDSCGHMSLIVELSQQLSTSESELKRAQLALKELGVES
ncbi:BICD family-like cargo adapter 1 isoform X2 [Halichondria panicea]|uniref:BICD family-like cargo adapter 1 isoform X2 n=1 Tax=Halichondria panicea TaxID=6063 RepID=UPI00312BBC1C